MSKITQFSFLIIDKCIWNSLLKATLKHTLSHRHDITLDRHISKHWRSHSQSIKWNQKPSVECWPGQDDKWSLIENDMTLSLSTDSRVTCLTMVKYLTFLWVWSSSDSFVWTFHSLDTDLKQYFWRRKLIFYI